MSDYVMFYTQGRAGMSAREPKRYEIVVQPESGEGRPNLPFLHRGDIYEDADGREFVIVKAVMKECPDDVYQWNYTAEPVVNHEVGSWED